MYIRKFDDKEQELINNISIVSLLVEIMQMSENQSDYKSYILTASKNIDLSMKMIFGFNSNISGYFKQSDLQYIKSSACELYEFILQRKKSLQLANNTGVLVIYDEMKFFDYSEFLTVNRIQKGSYDPFMIISSRVEDFAQKDHSKKIIMEFMIENKLDLSAISMNIKIISLLENEKSSYELLSEILLDFISYYVNDIDFSLISLEDQKIILFSILNLQTINTSKLWYELILYVSKKYQKLSDIDDDYLEEFTMLSKKYIKLRSEILEVITE